MAQEKAEMSGAGKDRILVLDANIMLRAVLGTRIRLLIERYAENVPLFIPSVCVAEVHEYLPLLCFKTQLGYGWGFKSSRHFAYPRQSSRARLLRRLRAAL